SWTWKREDPPGRSSRHPVEPAAQLSSGDGHVSFEPAFEPRARFARTGLSAQRRELLPEIRADVRISLRGPAGTGCTAAATGALDPKRLVSEIRTEPVEPDPGQRSRGTAGGAGPCEPQRRFEPLHLS